MPGRREQGAAIITALLVVSLATIVVSALFYRQNLATRSVENRLALAQTRWVERAVIDWAQVILRVDDSTFDHATDVWGTPVMQTELDETVTGGARIADQSKKAFLAGAMTDAQAKFNLNSLVNATNQPSPTALQALQRLFGLVGMDPALASAVQARVLMAQTTTQDGKRVPPQAPPLIRLADLLDVPGITEAMLPNLVPFVTVLPRPTPVNLNTAPAEVIVSVIPGANIGAAKRFVTQREVQPFTDLGKVMDAMGVQQGQGSQQQGQGGQQRYDATMVSLKTNYFFVSGVIKYDRVESQTETLLRRDGNRPNALVQVVWQQRN